MRLGHPLPACRKRGRRSRFFELLTENRLEEGPQGREFRDCVKEQDCRWTR